jgi:hypothetical protein
VLGHSPASHVPEKAVWQYLRSMYGFIEEVAGERTSGENYGN